MKRFSYSATIKDFLETPFDTIFGKLNNDDGDSELLQKGAWNSEINILKETLKAYAQEDAWIIFEYALIRLGKRMDVILLLRERIFVLEFKIGANRFLKDDNEQVLDYALDLKYFHQCSKDRIIIPILIATESKSFDKDFTLSSYDKNVFSPIHTNAEALGQTISNLLALPLPQVDYKNPLKDWIRSRYAPTPTIIEAAKALYINHSVAEITKSEAEGAQLDETTNYCLKVIQDTKERKGKSILFVTGVPGAGKTLVGLNVAIKQSDLHKGETDKAVYLSGNGPLVEVLTEALARDKKNQEDKKGWKKYKKETAKREVSQFIQIIHRYRDQMLSKLLLPIKGKKLEIDPEKEMKDKTSGFAEVENIAIFDEAQRSWNKKHLANWLKTKKKIQKFPISEGEFLIWSLNQRPDWAVIICLVGGGQEINTGEAGIGDWIRAINDSFPEWRIYISEKLTEKEYAEGNIKSLLAQNKNVDYSDSLHLKVSMRSFRAEKLSELVHHLLEGNIEIASAIYKDIKENYPIKLTRDLSKTKEWLREKARKKERYGLVVSSKAARLKPMAIDVRNKPKVTHWFLDDINDIRSSLFLEDAATEFEMQGLELDYVGLIWDGDMRRKDDEWEHFEFKRGSKWNKVNKSERKAYQLNAYRVLLTRARQGLIICVPTGDSKDSTRSPKYYDGTYEYLKSIGFDLM